MTSETGKSWLNEPDAGAGMVQANEEQYFDNFCQQNNI